MKVKPHCVAGKYATNEDFRIQVPGRNVDEAESAPQWVVRVLMLNQDAHAQSVRVCQDSKDPSKTIYWFTIDA